RFDAMLTLIEFTDWTTGRYDSRDPNGNALRERALNAMHTCPGLDAVIDTMIAGLKEPKTRLPMITALLKLSEGFGGMQGYSPTTPLEKLMDKASRAAHGAFDVPTVEKSLASRDWILRIAAVRHFGNPREDTNGGKLSEAEISQWKRLLPQMEKLAAGDDESIRYAAAESLRRIPGTEAFLAGRETNETSADVLMRLISDRYWGEEYQRHFLTRFVPLLSHPEEKVREGALTFIGFNSNSAPMYHIPFGMDVFDRVIASTQAKSGEERAAAAYALADIRGLDPDRGREAFLSLGNDPDENVRWRAPAGLAGQFEREDVKRAIAALVQDKSPQVRYFAIVAAGPPKYVSELEALSKGPDPLIADWATQKLKQVAYEKRNTTLLMVLTNIQSSIPELALVRTFGGSDYVEGVYIPANQRPLKLDPGRQGDLTIVINCNDSKEAAETALSSSLLRQTGPDQTETFQDLTVYRWSSEAVACRVGVYVVNVCAYQETARPLLQKALEALVKELGSSVKN
ncbi:MAG: HEAT repeat domain-containing protein, partial [Verrucomicrobiota bacterium]